MSAELAVMAGLVGIAFFMAWISFRLSQSQGKIFEFSAVLFLALSLGMLHIISISAVSIAENNGMTYLTAGLASPLLWGVNIFVLLFWILLLVRAIAFMIKGGWNLGLSITGHNVREDDEDEGYNNV